ncbi:PRC-barrel domain-containing protein [Pseudooceanicola nanhaiensis]|uniref:PRC-barrel domain-containing protein n=1 Tax=Pseudooceanicola nanhaiensis TaxID=375761 RepID=UPI0035142ABB
MKHLLLTTALVTATAAGVHAQSTDTNTNTAASGTMNSEMFRAESTPDELRASDFLGMRVYASAEGASEDAYEGAQEGWEDIGEINDVILNRDGEVQAVLVDIGGFLGIGERQVAVDMDALEFVSDSSTAENDGDFFLVLTADRATLEGAPAYGAAADGAMTDQPVAAEAEAETEEATQAAEAEAEEAGEEMEQTAENVEAEAEEAGAEMEQTAENVEAEAEEAGEEIEQSAENAAEETEQEVELAADATADAAAEAGEEVEQAADEAGEEIEEVGNEVALTDSTAPEADAEATASADANAEMDTTAGTSAFGADFAREGYSDAGMEYLTTENLTGARVYDTNDKWVGEISELVIDDEGKITDAIVDVGGFLGIGEKPVALQLSDLKILRQDEGDEVMVYTAMAEDELKSMPEFEKE